MSETEPNASQSSDEYGGKVHALIKAIMAKSGAKEDRDAFLRAQLKSHCPEDQVDEAISSNPAQARIPIETIDKMADSTISFHVKQAAAISFGAGVAGFTTALVAMSADAVQYMWHSIVLAQKLAYLYGWPNLMDEGIPDEETQMRILMLLGAMYGVAEANLIMSELSKQFAGEIARQLPRQALTKTAYYPVIKELCKLLGIRLTKKAFADAVAKIAPLVGGAVSAGVTGLTLRYMARRLKNHLRELEYAKPSSPKPITITVES